MLVGLFFGCLNRHRKIACNWVSEVFESIKPFFGNSKAAQHIVEILGGLGSMNVHEAWLALPPFLHHEDAAVREMAVKLLRNGSEFQMINGTLKTY